MFLNILKKDLRRKKTMNIILLMFIILTAMFVASGLNNVISVANGTDYYLDKAGIGDYVIVTVGDNSIGAISAVLENKPYIESLEIEKVIFGAQNNIFSEDGKTLAAKNSIIFQDSSKAKMNFFDEENNIIGSTSDGEVYVTNSFFEENNLSIGDKIRINHSGSELSLTLAGKMKDALFGTDFIANTRFLLSHNDAEALLSNETISAHYQGEIALLYTNDLPALTADSSEISGVSIAVERSIIKMCYIMDMIVAFVVLILSICLVIVSFAVLRFSISFTITEEFREIGVMKAIGLKNSKIRSLYITKYLALSIIGAVIGFFASIPFGELLLSSAGRNMVLGNDFGIAVNIISCAAVVGIIVLFAYSCTGKVKKSSPIDAIRYGQTGERFKKKSPYSLAKSRTKPCLYMAINDVLSNPKRFVTVIISFALCTLFVLMLVNTTSTMKSANLISAFTSKSDLYLKDVESMMAQMSSGSLQALNDYLKETEDTLAENGMPARVSANVLYKYKISFDEKDYSYTCVQAVGISSTEFTYNEGTPPQSAYEIALTPQISEKLGAKIGDYVAIDFGEGNKECLVTAYFHTMNNMGELIRLHEDAPYGINFISGLQSYQIDFSDNPTEEEIELRKDKIKLLFENALVRNAEEFCIECLSVADIMEAVQYLLLAITIVVVILVTVLVERSFIADERSQIAVLKAIGFSSRAIIKWQVYRFGLAALIASVLAAALSIPMTHLCITPIFAMMGSNSITYNINFLKIFVIFPGIVFLTTVVIAWITSLFTISIKAAEASNIE